MYHFSYSTVVCRLHNTSAGSQLSAALVTKILFPVEDSIMQPIRIPENHEKCYPSWWTHARSQGGSRLVRSNPPLASQGGSTGSIHHIRYSIHTPYTIHRTPQARNRTPPSARGGSTGSIYSTQRTAELVMGGVRHRSWKYMGPGKSHQLPPLGLTELHRLPSPSKWARI